MSKIERLLLKKSELQASFEFLSKKLGALRNAYAITDDPNSKFEYAHQIDKMEEERKNIEKHLEAIEALGDVTQIEEEESRLEFGIEIIMEKLQMIDRQISRIDERIDGLITFIKERKG